MSVALTLEYEAVLKRPEHLLFCGMKPRDVDVVLGDLLSVAERTRTSFQWRPQLIDANDEMVLETALNGGANAIVTFNRHDYSGIERSFRCKAVSPAEALNWVRRWKV